MGVLSHGGWLSPETLLWKDGFRAFRAPFMDNQMEKEIEHEMKLLQNLGVRIIQYPGFRSQVLESEWSLVPESLIFESLDPSVGFKA